MNAAAPRGPSPGLYAGIAAAVALLWIALLPIRPLFNPDEGRYAEIPREMLVTGDWVLPHLDGLVYIEKPPLQYWATAAALRLFGNGAFGARIYTGLCALATLVLVWFAAERLWGCAAAWRSAAVTASMLLFVVLGQLATLDMSLTFYLSLSLVAFLRAQQPGAAKRRWMWLAWAAAALGVLTKGLVAAVIPAAVLVLYSLGTRDWSAWRRLHPAVGLPLFLAIAVPWHWLAARRQPGFLQFFFVHEHLSRYLTPSADREEAGWFFAAVFLVGSLPWTVSAVRVAATGWRRRTPPGRFDPAVFLWVWVVFICVFFSLSDSKLIPYILPAMPGVALLIGASSGATLRREVLLTVLLTLVAAVTLAGTALVGPRFLAPTDRNHFFALLAHPLLEIAALLAACGALTLGRRGDSTRSIVFLGAGWCLAGLLLMRAAGVVAPIYSGADLAGSVAGIPAARPVYSVALYDQTLPFYWQRTMTLVQYRGELDFGLRLDPGAGIASVAEFQVQWAALADGYAVMEKSMFERLREGGTPMREVARDLNRVLVARR